MTARCPCWRCHDDDVTHAIAEGWTPGQIDALKNTARWRAKPPLDNSVDGVIAAATACSWCLAYHTPAFLTPEHERDEMDPRRLARQRFLRDQPAQFGWTGEDGG